MRLLQYLAKKNMQHTFYALYDAYVSATAILEDLMHSGVQSGTEAAEPPRPTDQVGPV